MIYDNALIINIINYTYITVCNVHIQQIFEEEWLSILATKGTNQLWHAYHIIIKSVTVKLKKWQSIIIILLIDNAWQRMTTAMLFYDADNLK